MARVFAKNENHNCDYGVDFVNGVAFVPDSEVALLEQLRKQGYNVQTDDDILGSPPFSSLSVDIGKLSIIDTMNIEQLRIVCQMVGVDPDAILAHPPVEQFPKLRLIAAIEQGLWYMTRRLSSWVPISDIDAGTVANPLFADEADIIVKLPKLISADTGFSYRDYYAQLDNDETFTVLVEAITWRRKPFGASPYDPTKPGTYVFEAGQLLSPMPWGMSDTMMDNRPSVNVILRP